MGQQTQPRVQRVKVVVRNLKSFQLGAEEDRVRELRHFVVVDVKHCKVWSVLKAFKPTQLVERQADGVELWALWNC